MYFYHSNTHLIWGRSILSVYRQLRLFRANLDVLERKRTSLWPPALSVPTSYPSDKKDRVSNPKPLLGRWQKSWDKVASLMCSEPNRASVLQKGTARKKEISVQRKIINRTILTEINGNDPSDWQLETRYMELPISSTYSGAPA